MLGDRGLGCGRVAVYQARYVGHMDADALAPYLAQLGPDLAERTTL